MDEFTKRRNELNQASIQVSTNDFLKARDGIDKGEASYRIDKETE